MSEGLIYKQIPKIMDEVGAIEKNRKNEGQNYKFRGVDDVYAALQLIMAKHGVFVAPEVLPDYAWTEHQTARGGTMFSVRSRIKHTFYAEDGSCFETVTFGEAMDSGDKAANKAMSVAIKYALIEVFCIPTSDPKDPESDNPQVLPKNTPVAPPAEPKPTPAASAEERKAWAEGGRAKFDADMEGFKKALGTEAYRSWLDIFGYEKKADIVDPNHAREVWRKIKHAAERMEDAKKRT